MNEENTTLADVMEAVDEYLNSAEITCILYDEAVDCLYNDVYNGELTIEAADYMLNEYYMYLIESKQDVEDFLKDHDYDEKSKTIKYDNRRVRIGDMPWLLKAAKRASTDKENKKIDDNVGVSPGAAGRSTNITMKRKDVAIRNRMDRIGSKNDQIKKIASKIKPTASEKQDKMIRYAADHDIPDVAYLRKIRGIGVDGKTLEKLNRGDIEYLMGHEYGHIKDFADERKANRALSFFDKYNSNTIYKLLPKDMRSEFVKWTRKSRNKDMTPDEWKEAEKFIDKLTTVVKNSDLYKNDKEVQHKDEYERTHKLAQDATNKINPKRLLASHDKDYREIKADSEGISQAQKYTGKTPSMKKSLNRAIGNSIDTLADNASKDLPMPKKVAKKGLGKLVRAVNYVASQPSMNDRQKAVQHYVQNVNGGNS